MSLSYYIAFGKCFSWTQHLIFYSICIHTKTFLGGAFTVQVPGLKRKYSWTLLFPGPKGNGKKFEIAGFRNTRGSVKFVTMNHFLIKYSIVNFTMSNDQNRDSRVHTWVFQPEQQFVLSCNGITQLAFLSGTLHLVKHTFPAVLLCTYSVFYKFEITGLI